MIGNNKIIHFLSASDRINYGDLLFPLIFKSIAEKRGFKFKNYGIIRSDLAHFGALPTKSYKNLLKNIKEENGKLIIGGGEVFFADWRTLYGFINPYYSKALKIKIVSKIDSKLGFAKFYLSLNQVAVPFCPAKKELRNDSIKIYYSSVGGSYPYGKKNEEVVTIKEALNDADLISVRDQRTQNELQKLNIETRVVPDSAILLSDVFSEKDILKYRSRNFKIPESSYIFVQLGINKGPRDLRKFALSLKKISQILKLEVVLCPIGKAPGHEDHIILKAIKNIEIGFKYIEPHNIYDIMFLISNASLYMGTSLHGVITAQSFNIPFIGLNEKLIKVHGYTTTWIGKNFKSIPFEDIENVIEIYKKWESNLISNKNEEQKKMVLQNIYDILDD